MSDELTLADMRVGVRCIVMHDSDDKEFQRGDRIRLCADGDIINEQAGGWVDAESVPLATRGMTVVVDLAWLARKREQLAEQVQLAEQMAEMNK